MKILYLVSQFYPAHHGGTEKFVLQLAQRMQALGHDVKIIAYDDGNRTPISDESLQLRWFSHVRRRAAQRLRGRCLRTLRRTAVNLRNGLRSTWRTALVRGRDAIECYEDVYEGVPVLGFRAAHLDEANFGLADPHMTAFAEALLKRESPDLIHAGYLCHTAEFLHVAHRLGVPYLMTLTSFFLMCPKHIMVNESNRMCSGPRGGEECRAACPSFSAAAIAARWSDMRRLVKHAAAVVVPSRHMADVAQRELGDLCAGKLVHIPYGVDCEISAVETERRTHPVERPLTFFYAGRLVEEKGLAMLLQVFAKLKSPRIRLRVFGDGLLRVAVKRAAHADSRIEYGGVYSQDQAAAHLQNADVVVVPSSWHENMPLVMQEAQVCGVPTLVADVAGMTECVTDGVNGYVFRTGDASDLQRVMQRVIDRPEELRAVAENVRRPRPGAYRATSLERVSTLYLQQYESVLSILNVLQ